MRRRIAGTTAATRRGNALLMMLPFIIYMVIFGYALIRRTSAEHTQTFLTHRRHVALYAAEGVLACADNYVRKEIDDSMKEDFVENRVKSLNLYAHAKTVKAQVDELLKEQEGVTLEKLILDYVDVGKFRGGSPDDPNDAKESYGTLVFAVEVKYVDQVCRLDVTRDVKIVNVTPPASDYTFCVTSPQATPADLNKGCIIECNNKDKITGKLGKVRLAGHNTLDVGTADFLIAPWGGKSLLPPPQGLLAPAKVSPTPLVDPGFAYWGAQISNTQPGNISQSTRAKIRLFGFYSKVQPGKVVPTQVEGKVEKHYRKVPYVLNSMASSAASAEGIPVYIYNIDPSKYQDIIEEYKTHEGPGPNATAPMTGTRVKSPDDYRARATTFTESLQLGHFSLNDFTYVRGIHLCNAAEIGASGKKIHYAGRSLIVADNEMRLMGDFLVDPKYKEITSMGLLHLPVKVVDKPFEFKKSKAVMEANLYARNGIVYTGPPPAFWRPINIHGNYVCDKANVAKLKGTVNVFYRDRMGKGEYDALCAQVSPIVSSYQVTFDGKVKP